MHPLPPCVNRDKISSVLWPRWERMSTALLEFTRDQTQTKPPQKTICLQSFPWQMSRYAKKDFCPLAARLSLLLFKPVFSKERSRNCQLFSVIEQKDAGSWKSSAITDLRRHCAVYQAPLNVLPRSL